MDQQTDDQTIAAENNELSKVYLGVVEKRRSRCLLCTRCGGVEEERVECNAAGRAISLIHGRCRLRMWPSPGSDSTGNQIAMPKPPPPPPEPPEWLRWPVVPHATHKTPGNQSRAGRECHCLFVYGFPGLYAGASTELHHQIILWRSMGIEVHLIPTDKGYKNEPLYQEMLDRGVTVHHHDEFSAIIPGCPVLGFCNDRFLANTDRILEYSHNTVFVNCMTWLFDMEKRRHREGKIAAFLYQNDAVRKESQAALREINPDPEVQYLTFKPYFDVDAFPFDGAEEGAGSRKKNTFTIGHISRADADKFSAETLQIWEAIESLMAKHGVMLGFGRASVEKIGIPRQWIKTYENQNELSQQDFYAQVDVIVQPTDTTENWPRIGLEAMASGVVLIVDNRGGWQQMIEHGVTGWLCDTPEDFIKYATRMAHETEERAGMARRARERLQHLAGPAASAKSWRAAIHTIHPTTPQGGDPRLERSPVAATQPVTQLVHLEYLPEVEEFIVSALGRYEALPADLRSSHFALKCPSPELAEYMAVVLKSLSLWDQYAGQNDIRYCLAAGSAIGARLLGGPVPWDDDVDLCVREQDWAKLEALWDSGGPERPSRMPGFTLREVEIEGHPIDLLKHNRRAGWFKFRLRSRFDSDGAVPVNGRVSGTDVGGIDIFYVMEEGDRVYESLDQSQPLPTNLLSSDLVKRSAFGPVLTYVARDQDADAYLEKKYGKCWRDLTHPAMR